MALLQLCLTGKEKVWTIYYYSLECCLWSCNGKQASGPGVLSTGLLVFLQYGALESTSSTANTSPFHSFHQ